MIDDSDIIWLEESAWVGSEFEFQECEGIKWKITSKISENEEFWEECFARDQAIFSNARAVFVCCDPQNPTQEAILKVRLQIPRWWTWSESAKVRAEQASSAPSKATVYEIEALQLFTEAKCSSVSKFIAFKHQVQSQSDWVPGGFLDLILMERMPGREPSDSLMLQHFMPSDERAELREAFKIAWQDCIACGTYHQDARFQNLIWNREQKKCYIIDWERWEPLPSPQISQADLTWSNHVYARWNLVISHRGSDRDDFSKWEF